MHEKILAAMERHADPQFIENMIWKISDFLDRQDAGNGWFDIVGLDSNFDEIIRVRYQHDGRKWIYKKVA